MKVMEAIESTKANERWLKIMKDGEAKEVAFVTVLAFKCVKKLVGSWATHIWQHTRGKLFIRGVYYYYAT